MAIQDFFKNLLPPSLTSFDISKANESLKRSNSALFNFTPPGILKMIAQGTAAGVGSVGLTVMNPILKRFGQQPIDISADENAPIKRFMFGENAVRDLPTRITSGTKVAEGLGFGKASPLISGGAVFGLTALDLTGFGGGKHAAIHLGKEGLEKIAKSGVADDIFKILKKGATNVGDDVLKSLSDDLVKATNTKAVDFIVKRKLTNLTPKVVEGNFEQIGEKAGGWKPGAKGIFDKAMYAKNADEVKRLLPDVPKEYQQRFAVEIKNILGKAGKVLPSKLERGFITSAKEVVPEAQKIAGQYVPRATDDLAIKAKNLIRDDIVAAEKLAMTGADDNAVAVAAELIKKYGDDAAKATDAVQAGIYYDKAADIANTIAPKLTEAGRTVQAASILGRLTPEGQIRFAAKEIQRYNQTATKAIPELTGEQAKFIGEEMKAIQEMANGVERAARFQKLQDYIKDLVPTPLFKKLIAVWKAGLLTGIKTSGLNFFSNASHYTTETVKDVPATIVDKVASLFTKQRTKTFNLGSKEGVQEGFEKGLRYFKTGFDERNIAQKLDYHKVNFGKGKVAKAFQTYTDTVFRAMGSADQPFYYGVLARSLGDQATAQGLNKGLKGKALKEFAEELVKNPTEEMLRYAVSDAATAVFQNQTYLGKAAKALQNIPIVGEIVVPFGRTPSAVATQIVNYTPIGTAAEIVKQIAKKKFDQRLFSEAVGRGLTGTGVLYLGWKLAQENLISLDRPTTEREQKLWELEGRKPNSIKLGGKWRSPTILGPSGNLLLVGAHFARAFKESGSPTEALSKAILGSGKSFTEQTFLTGINSAANALNDPDRYAESYLGQMVSSVIPTLVSDVARAIDPKERRTQTTPQRVQARIPGARQGLEPQVDVLGRERESVGNPLEILADPTRPQEDITTPVVAELRRLTDAGFKVSPTLLGDKAGYDGLTPQQNTQLWKRAGEIIDAKLDSLFKSADYKKLSDEEKGKIVENFIDKAKIVARAEIVIQLTNGLQREEIDAKLSELKAGGVMTRDVYNKYLELR